MKRGILFVFVILSIISLSIISASVPQTINVQGKLTNSTGSVLTGTYNITFRIYNSYTGGTELWNSNNLTLITDSGGVYNAMLNVNNLSFDEQYYLGITVNLDSEMSPRINLTSSPYTYRAKNITISGIEPDANLDIGIFNITSSWFFGLYNWIIGLIGIGSSNNYLIFNGSTLSFNETYLNGTILSEGIRLGFNSTYNATYSGYALNVSLNHTKLVFDNWNSTWDNSWINVYNNTWYNHTLSTYNTYNDAWLSTYNVTYNNYPNILNETLLTLSINSTINIQNLLNSTGIYSTPLTINSTLNIGNLYNSTALIFAQMNNNTNTLQILLNGTGIYSTPLTINTTANIGNLYNVTANMIANLTFLQNFTLANIQSFLNNTNMWFNSLSVGSSNKIGDFYVVGNSYFNISGAQNFSVFNTIGTSLFHINGTNGYVGIGTTSPVATLEVNGSINSKSGTTAVLVSAAVETIFTIKANEIWEVYAMASDGNSDWKLDAVVWAHGADDARIVVRTGTNMDCVYSGTSIQLKNTSGTNSAFKWVVIRVK
jgi:hypothetical protein